MSNLFAVQVSINATLVCKAGNKRLHYEENKQPIEFALSLPENTFQKRRWYINATLLCKAGNKFNDYSRLAQTKEFL
jgi:hypothetical protein